MNTEAHDNHLPSRGIVWGLIVEIGAIIGTAMLMALGLF